MYLPFRYKGRMAARVATGIWFHMRGRGGERRRARLGARIGERGLAQSFFAAAQAPADLILPEPERQRIVQEAERAIGGTLTLLGLQRAECGDPIDWYRDPVTGRRFPTGLLDIQRDSDIDWKFADELNKHRHFYALGQAYALTGEPRFRDAALRQLAAWLDANPPIEERHWRDGLECAIRVVAWLWLLYLLRSRGELALDETTLLVDAVRQHTRFIERDTPPYMQAYNHLIARAAALAIVGAALPCLAESSRWLGRGLELLERETTRQFCRDGGHREKSIGYHVFVLEAYTHVVILCRNNHIQVPDRITKALERMYDFVLHVMRPDGMLPNIGDEAIGWHQISRRPPLDARRLLSTGAVLFRRPDMKWAARGFSADSVWLCGRGGAQQFEELPGREPALAADLSDSGLVVWRDRWEPEGSYLIFDGGSQGVGQAGHGHADALSVELFAHGAPLVVDSGTFTYYMHAGWRRHFRGTAAHNTVAVDGEDQAAPGPDRFFWLRTADAHLRSAWINPLLAFADGHHDGYRRLPQPVRHRRLLFWVAQRYWVVYDILSGAGTHRCESFFHFPPVPVALDSDDRACRVRANGAGLQVIDLPDPSQHAALVRGAVSPPQGWVSRAYGHKEAAPVLVHSHRGEMPVVFGAVLVPEGGIAAPAVDVARVPLTTDGTAQDASGAACIRVALDDGTVDYLVWADRPGWTVAGDVATDAQVALVRVRPAGAPLGFCVPDGQLRWRGEEVWRQNTPTAAGSEARA